MAQYLGKISAVISANTQDFTRNIGNTQQALNAFQRRLNGIRLNLDTSSFDRTLTRLQIFQRTMQEAHRLNIDVSVLERMHAIFEDVGKPLIDVKNDIEKMTNTVQAELYPALGQIQAGFQNMQRAVQSGATVSQQAIENLLDCLSKLRASTAVVKDIEGLALKLAPENTGATFVQPHAQDELKRAASLRDRAGKMSADIRSEPEWQQVNANTFGIATEINKAAAAAEKYKLELDSANKWLASALTPAERLSAEWLQVQAAEGLALEQGNVDAYTASLRKVNDQVEKRLRLEEGVAKQSKMFISASGGAGDKLDPVLEGAASDIMTARQFRGNFGADNVTGRLNVTRAIQQVEERITALIRQRHEIEEDSLLTNVQMAHALDANRRSIEHEADALLRYTAAQSGGSASEDQVLAAAKRRRKNTGSMGMGSFGNLDLAFQQGMFAIDDFMSATGELEYKLRAVSNNITQLGLMVGQSGLIKGLTATRGLFLGLAAVIGAEVAIAVSKWAFDTEKAKERVKAMNAVLSEQKSSADRLAESYSALAKAVGELGASEDRQRTNAREDKVSAISKASLEMRLTAGSMNPDAIEARVHRSDAEKALDASPAFYERDGEYRARRFALLGGLESSRRVEARLRVSSASESTSSDDIKGILSGNAPDRRSYISRIAQGMYEEVFDTEAARNAVPKDKLAAIAEKALAGGGGRHGLMSGLIQQRDVLDEARAKVIQNKDLSATQRRDALFYLDQELGHITEGLKGFADLMYADAHAVEQSTRIILGVGDELAKGKASISQAFGSRSSASRIQSDMDDLSDVLEMLEQQMSDAIKNGEDPAAFKADAEAAKKMAVELRAAADYVSRFADAMTRATKTLDQDLGRMQSRADEERMRAIHLDDGEATARATAAQNDFDAARRRKQEIDDKIAGAIERAEANPQNVADSRRIAEIDAQLAVPMGQIGENGINGGTEGDRERLRRKRRWLVEQSRARIDASGDVVAARGEADDFSRQTEGAFAAERGRLLGMTAKVKAEEDMKGKIADIGARADVLKGGDKFDFVRQATVNMAREVAPMLADFGVEVRNAQLGGPSRQALNSSDVTTMQGQGELHRLLRGEDPSKDVNFVEMQKQTELLRDLPAKIAEATGIVLDFK